jgi:hypothetical protein
MSGTATPMHETRASEAGFGMTIIAITIAMVMGISVGTYMRQLSNQALQFQDMYAASQARWSALSGIEYGLYKAELGEVNLTGTYNFYNSSVELDTLESDPAGYSVPEYHYTIVSRGTLGSAYRDLRVFAKKSLKAVWGDVSIIEGTGDVDIETPHILNDSLYIGQNVSILTGTHIGDPTYGVATHLYVPSTKSVSGIGGAIGSVTTGTHPLDEIFNPDFDTVPYDSLIAIADAITSDIDNKFFKNETFKNVTIDLNTYTDSTIFCNQTFKFQGCTITGGDANRPGVIVASTKIVLELRTTQTTVGDNVILISGGDIQILDGTTFGLDHSGLTPENRPNTLNLMYSPTYILIHPGATVWSQTFSNDDLRLEGALYGIAYAPDLFTFRMSTSYLEGAMFAVEVVGNGGSNLLNRGRLNLNHYFNEDYFKTFDYGVVDRSLIEY